MTDEPDSVCESAGNVVPFEPPRRQEPPDLRHVELRLGDRAIEMTVIDDAGDSFVLVYRLASVPEDFDLDRLVAAWSRWRGGSTAAS